MKLLAYICTVVLVITSCNRYHTANTDTSEECSETLSTKERTVLLVNTDPSNDICIEVANTNSFAGAKDRARLDRALDLLQTVINSDSFYIKIMRETFDVSNLGMDNLAIYQLIVSGRDDVTDDYKDRTMVLRLALYDCYRGGSEFGYTDMVSHTINTHHCFFRKNCLRCYVAHLAHEYMHVMGFTHGLIRKTSSVPYKIGNLVADMLGYENCVYSQGCCTSE